VSGGRSIAAGTSTELRDLASAPTLEDAFVALAYDRAASGAAQ
jgi:hypothetical protein